MVGESPNHCRTHHGTVPATHERQKNLSAREFRRWFTAKAAGAFCAAAPTMPMLGAATLERFLASAGHRLPVIGGLVRANLEAAGLFTPDVHRAYFAQVGVHLANSLRILKFRSRPDRVAELAREQIGIDSSVSHLRDALALGRGAIVAAPHVCNYVMTLVRLNQEIPITVYLRWSSDERKRELKHTWCKASGLPVILEAPDAANPTARAAACVEALRSGAALVMTPDIAQKDTDKGVPVRMLNRQPSLPSGPASIAMLAEAPIVPVYGRLEGDRHIITAAPPIFVESLSRAEGGRRMALHRAMQKWADGFSKFLTAFPQAWFLWADSRWTRVFRNDSRYRSDMPGTPTSEVSPTGVSE